MPLRYVPAGQFQSEHTDFITTLSFSPKGNFLAAGGLDGRLTIWSTETASLLHVVEGHRHNPASFLSLEWVPPGENHIICGLEGGTVISVTFDTDLSVTGYKAHSLHLPVEHLALSAIARGTVATGAQNEVRLWNIVGEQWNIISELQQPPTVGINEGSEEIITSLQFAETKYADHTLLVSYMHHGLIFWDVATSERKHFMSIKTLSGHTSLSPDYKYLAVSNLRTGFDLYQLETGEPWGCLRQAINTSLRVPVKYIHSGFAVMGGSTSGQLNIWDFSTRKILQTLTHHDCDKILAIDAHVNTGTTGGDLFMIAAGVSQIGSGESSVQLWRAVEIDACKGVSAGQVATPPPRELHRKVDI
ncbi:WD40-repeat-containing domain protein [Suillus subluteus]|nr:WD40-repeat-containing domain protein [Suillus subluteus]